MPSPPSKTSCGRDGAEPRGVDHVVAAETVDLDRVVGGSKSSITTCVASPLITSLPFASIDSEIVSLPLVPLIDDRVGLPVAGRPPIAPARSMLTSLTSVPVRSLTTMLSAPPSALKSMRLDVVQVHDDVGDVAEEQHTPAVRRDVDVLGDVGAVEQHRVGAVLALERVVVVARVPHEGVVAGAHECGVVAVAAVEQVVALAADA